MKKPPDVIVIAPKDHKEVKIINQLCLIEYAYKVQNKYLLVRAMEAIFNLSKTP
jgi:hypothetical protein